jgi:hypothetical protein
LAQVFGLLFSTRSRCGSAVKWWNEKINKIKRSRVRSPVRATFCLKKFMR